MTSNKKYLEYVLDQLLELEDITYKSMMRDYISYYRGEIVDVIYDDRFLVTPVKSEVEYNTNAKYEYPYEVVKEMILVEKVDNKEFLNDY